MKKYLVIGNPIEHSQSPQLHNYWIKKNNINGIYEKQLFHKHELKDLIFKVKEKKINGINITVPFKKEIIPYLDELSPEAKLTGSVNTINLVKEKVVGYNTDITGFEFAIKDINFDLNKKKVLILGAGGVVSSIIFALNKMRISEVTITNRTREKAENLKDIFRNLKIVDWGVIPYFDVIINATSLGLHDSENIDLDFSKVGKNKLFYDVIYNPKETNFLKKAKAMGNMTENGKRMFIYQAAEAFRIWHGILPKINLEVERLLDK
jgi:shikimate dehydrogenase